MIYEHTLSETAARQQLAIRRALCLQCEVGVDPTTCPHHQLEPHAIDSAPKRYSQWLAVCRDSNGLGADNYLKTSRGGYIIDTRPRVLKNGAMVGRLSRFKLDGHGGLVDAGGWKIDRDGVVVNCPEELRADLPGAESATVGEPAHSE